MEHKYTAGGFDEEAAQEIDMDSKLSTRQLREGNTYSTKDEKSTPNNKRGLIRRPTLHSKLLNLEQNKSFRQSNRCFDSQGSTADSDARYLSSNGRPEPSSPSGVVVEESTKRLSRLARQLVYRQAEIQQQVEYVKILQRERDLRLAACRARTAVRWREAAKLAAMRGHRSAYPPARLQPTQLHSPTRSPSSFPRHSAVELSSSPTRVQQNLYSQSSCMAQAAQRATIATSSSSTEDIASVTSEHVADDKTQAQVANSCRPAPGKGVSLFLASDKAILSGYQIQLRNSIEFFEVQPIDQINAIPGRKKVLEVGQVGIRCRYCAHRPSHWRERGAVYYPKSLNAVYQAAQNMGTVHLMNACTDMPQSVKDSFSEARQQQKKEIRRSGGTQYWVQTCRHVGLVEREGRNGMWFTEEPSP